MKQEKILDIKRIPKNPILFGLAISKLYKKWAVLAFIAVCIGTALSRISVVILNNLTNAISAQPVVAADVWLWGGVYIGIFIFSEVFWRTSGFMGLHWFMNFRFAGYQSLYEYLTLHSKEYFSSRFAGSIANKITHAVDGTQSLFENFLWNFSPLVMGLIWFSIFSFYSNMWLGLIISIWSIVFLLINVWFAKLLHPYSFESAAAGSVLKGRIVDSLSNISLVHEFAFLHGERSYVKNFVTKDKTAGVRMWSMSEWLLVANNVLIFFFMILMLGTALYLFLHHLISAGVVVMVIAIVLKLLDQLLFLGQQIREVTRYYGEAKEGLTEILKEHIIIDTETAAPLVANRGSITLADVNFEYENKKVFSNFSLAIHPGEKIGLVGKSGAGKTTFVSLLLRHFDIQKGDILIDGQSIYHVTLESLRRSIAFVPQDTSLFHRTIKENIGYSNPQATDEQIKHAAKLAHADEFIRHLPNGYETLVGERGIKLSGGQRQRIAIARAFLKNAPIIVLDEATSSLDSESEGAIQASLEDLIKDRTVIAIAHRLSTLKEMDRIIVMKEGKIVEDGNPDKLLQKSDGVFKQMWDHQVKGFIPDE